VSQIVTNCGNQLCNPFHINSRAVINSDNLQRFGWVDRRGEVGGVASVQYRRLPRCIDQRQLIGEPFTFPLDDGAIVFHFFTTVCNLD